MTSRVEGSPSAYYSRLIAQMGHDPQFSSELTQHLLHIKRACSGELRTMRELVDILKPTPNYIFYGGAVYIPISKEYFCHSITKDSFAEVLMGMNESYGEKRFTVDADNQIVAADVNALIPVVPEFTHVIRSGEVYRLPKDHPGVLLHSLAHRVIRKVAQAPGTHEFIFLIIAEGINETVNHISVASPRFQNTKEPL